MNNPACAHLTIRWRTQEVGVLTRGWWACEMCHMLFVPQIATIERRDGMERVNCSLCAGSNCAACGGRGWYWKQSESPALGGDSGASPAPAVAAEETAPYVHPMTLRECMEAEEALPPESTTQGCQDLSSGESTTFVCHRVRENTIRKITESMMDGLVITEMPKDLRNRIGQFMWERGITMGDKIDAGRVQDLIEEWSRQNA